MSAKSEWRQGEFLVSTDKALFQLSAINAAYATEYIYWANPVEESQLQKMLDNSLAFGLYQVAASDVEGQRTSPLSKIITDYFYR